MSGLSKVIVLDPDERASRQLELGFLREGVPTTAAAVPADSTQLELFRDGVSREADLVVIGGTFESDALGLIRCVRSLLEAAQLDAPIVFAGRGVRRTEAEAAGADEVVILPAHLRDIVTVGRLLRGVRARQRAHIVGNLAETTGVFTLVRALSALGRSAVLTLIRGLRRGEVRFYHGEVTSAQVGLIHGQAALHQLLLWTDARFDFRHEDVVRRQQIPLAHDELFADAEHFLATVRESSGALSPSMVLEHDVTRIRSFGNQIPTEVHGVLRMFDGHRVLADVLEDSPYRVFETLRVTQRAVEIGLLRQTTAPRRKATWRAVLAIEEWLVGGAREPLDSNPADSGPTKAADTEPHAKTARRKRNKRRADTPDMPAIQTKPEIDWGALVPRTVGAEVGRLAGVVPATHASGEIVRATREAPRERLEALMDTDQRERIFPREAAVEAKVVWDDAADPISNPAAVAAAEIRSKIASRDGADELARRLAAARPATLAAAADRARVEADARAAAEMTARAEEEARAAIAAKRAALATGIETPSLVVAETPAATVRVSDRVTVTTTDHTARLLAVPIATITAAPLETIDDASDGVIRDKLATADWTPTPTDPGPFRAPRDPDPFDDRPDDAIGEITAPIARREKVAPVDEPSILVADLGAVHGAVSAIAHAQARAPGTPDASSPLTERVVSEVRKDARIVFTEIEEDFFRSGTERAPAPPKTETFDDLDRDYEHVGFWDRLLGRRPPKR